MKNLRLFVKIGINLFFVLALLTGCIMIGPKKEDIEGRKKIKSENIEVWIKHWDGSWFKGGYSASSFRAFEPIALKAIVKNNVNFEPTWSINDSTTFEISPYTGYEVELKLIKRKEGQFELKVEADDLSRILSIRTFFRDDVFWIGISP